MGTLKGFTSSAPHPPPPPRSLRSASRDGTPPARARARARGWAGGASVPKGRRAPHARLSLRHVGDHAVLLLEGQLAGDGVFGSSEVADAHAVPGAFARDLGNHQIGLLRTELGGKRFGLAAVLNELSCKVKCALPLAESVAAARTTGTGALGDGAGVTSAGLLVPPPTRSLSCSLPGVVVAGLGAPAGVAAWPLALALPVTGVAFASVGLPGSAGLLSSLATNLLLPVLVEVLPAVAEAAWSGSPFLALPVCWPRQLCRVRSCSHPSA